MKKHGEKRSGKQLRRGNNTGTLYRKKDSKGSFFGPWYMVFSEFDPNGKRVRVYKSTKTTDLEKARELLKENISKYGFDLPDEQHVDKLLEVRRNIDNERARIEREELERKAKEAAEREAKDIAERERNALSFADAFDVFFESKKRPDSGPETMRHYNGQYNRFVAWIKSHYPHVIKMRDFTPTMAEEFVGELEQTQSRSTRNKYVVFLRMFWKVLRWDPNSQLEIDPWDGIRNLVTKSDEIIHKELTVEELAAIGMRIKSPEPLSVVREKGNAVRKAGNIRDVFTFQGVDIRDQLRVLFALGIYTGARLGDCVTMQWGNIDLVRGIIIYTPRKTARKYARQVVVPIHVALSNILKDYAPKGRSGYVLPVLSNMYLTCDSMLTRRIQSIMRDVGIRTSAKGESGTRNRTQAGFHSLRHTFSSIMLNAGVSPVFVDAMLCHGSGSMTMRYYHEHAEALATAICKLPRLPEYIKGKIREKLPVADVDDEADKRVVAFSELRHLLGGMPMEDLKRAAGILADTIAVRRSIEQRQVGDSGARSGS